MLISQETFDDLLIPFVEENVTDPFIGTLFAGYSFLSAKRKGLFGELIFQEYCDANLIPISGAGNPGHDIVVNGIRAEVKISLSRKNRYTINHMSVGKDWETAYFIIGNPHTEVGLYKITKNAFIECIQKELFFKRQQGGNKGGNDDYICSDKPVLALINSPYVSLLDVWRP